MDLSQAQDIVYNGNTVSAVYLGQQLVWPSTPPAHDYSQDYLTFDNISASCRFSFIGNDIQYSLDDGTTWLTLSNGTGLSVNSGQKIIWKASGLSTKYLNLDGGGGVYLGIGGFMCSSDSNDIYFDVYGNVMSLIYGDNYIGQTTLTQSQELKSLFCALTQSTTNPRLPHANPCPIRDASNLVLPATTLTWKCYGNMFELCDKLISAPVLPATTLTGDCYAYMFQNCTSLVNAPALPATTLTEWCYGYMFNGCTSLVNAPALPATTLAIECYQSMFQNCTSLVNAPALPATTLDELCYQDMFQGCTSLVSAPVLPALQLTLNCYCRMFYNCTNLNYIKCLATDISATNCTTGWLSGVSSSGTFTKAASMNNWTTGSSGIPSGWTVQDYSA